MKTVLLTLSLALAAAPLARAQEGAAGASPSGSTAESATAPGSAADVESALAVVRASYKDVRALDMTFEQTSSGVSYFEPFKQAGRLMVERPGKLRWEFHGEQARTWISDGSTLWIVDEVRKNVQLMKGVDAAIARYFSFLTGLKDVQKDFTVTLAAPPPAGGVALELVPKVSDDSVARILVELGESGRVGAVSVFNTFGDTTRLVLASVKEQPDLDDALFRWQDREGWDVLPPPG